MDCKMNQMNQLVIVRLVCVSYLLRTHKDAYSCLFILLGFFVLELNWPFIYSRCTKRVFGEEQWLTLRTKLATWRVSNFNCFFIFN